MQPFTRLIGNGSDSARVKNRDVKSTNLRKCMFVVVGLKRSSVCLFCKYSTTIDYFQSKIVHFFSPIVVEMSISIFSCYIKATVHLN